MALKSWSTTASSNATVGSINFAENQAPSTVNDSARALMADVRTWYEATEWRDFGHTPSYVDTASFTVSTDLTSVYTENRPIRCTDATTLYGKVASSSYSAPDTTVNVTLDSGSLSASLTAVSLGLDVTGYPVDVAGVRDGATNSTEETIVGAKTFAADLTFEASAVSTKAAESGYSRVTPNMCRVTTLPSFTALTINVTTLITGPTGAKGLILEVKTTAKTNSTIGTNSAATIIYSDSGATTAIAGTDATGYDFLGTLGAGTVVLQTYDELHVKCDSSQQVWIKATTNNTQGGASYRIVGYYD